MNDRFELRLKPNPEISTAQRDASCVAMIFTRHLEEAGAIIDYFKYKYWLVLVIVNRV